MSILTMFKKKEFVDYDTYKAHIDFLDDVYFRQRMMKREMAKV
jgi:hypothetical protein